MFIANFIFCVTEVKGKLQTFIYNNENQNFIALFEVVPIFFSVIFYWYIYTARKTPMSMCFKVHFISQTKRRCMDAGKGSLIKQM